MGGPFWAGQDDRAWSFPKGEYEADEAPEDAARREFAEELGLPVPHGTPVPLGSAQVSSVKTVTLWALEGDLDPEAVVPGTFTMEWPRGSGRRQEFPELDRVAWFALDRARGRLVGKQAVFLDRLTALLGD